MAAGGGVEKENPNPSGVDADSSSTTLDMRVMLFTEAVLSSFIMPSIQHNLIASLRLQLATLTEAGRAATAKTSVNSVVASCRCRDLLLPKILDFTRSITIHSSH